MRFDRDMSTMIKLFALEVIWMLFSIGINIFCFNIPFSLSDMGEFSRPIFNMLMFLEFAHLVQTSNTQTIKGVFIIFLAISIFNFLLSYIPQVQLDQYSDLVALYGEGENMSYGYASFRSFGIVGQPGKNAAFISFLSLGLLFFTQKKGYNTYLVWAFVLLNLVAIIFTASRTGLITFSLIVFLFSAKRFKLSTRSVILFLTIGIGIYYLIQFVGTIYDYELLSRGLEENQTGTFDKRMYLKKWAFDVITDHPIQTLFGTGPSKEYLSSFTTSYADDLYLIAPDSSYTLWMLRYGFGGLIVFSLPFLYLFFSKVKNVRKYYDLLFTIIILLFILQIDPLMHEPKTQMFIWFVISLFIYNPRGIKENYTLPRSE